MDGFPHESLARHRKLTVVGLLVVIALEVVALAASLSFAPSKPEFAYLIKSGGEYLVAWSEGGPHSTALSSRHDTLDGALSFARLELNVELGPVTHTVGQIEKLWIENRDRGYVLQWKVDNNPHLLRLTFRDEADATFFEKAFRLGAYRPSPVGHSIVLLPPEKQPHSFY